MMKIFSTFSSLFTDYIPKSVICWREGYTREILRNDLIAGVTVGIIALPLAMAFAIGSGVKPEQGLFTAIVAGFLISLLGGSRIQIGGPTGAFVVIVYSVVQRHGYEGLAIATLMAGVMIFLMGMVRAGVLLKFIPYPVTTGFTSGIALVIFSSQIKDFFGLNIEEVPADFVEKWILYAKNIHTWNPWTSCIAAGTLSFIFIIRKYYPKFPSVVAAVVASTAIVYFYQLPVDTILSKFGEIPRTLPWPSFPTASFEMIRAVFPDAITIALLGAIESLLSAVVADGMTGTRHRSNCELIAQGLANIGSSIFGGIPATGAIARTTANIKMGAKTPLSGMIHALTLVLLMLILAPVAALIPLPALAAVLIYIAWNMSEIEHISDILKGQRSDRLVLITTFLLTVLIDLTVAVQVGVLLAAVLFLKRMTDTTSVHVCKLLIEENVHENPETQDSNLIFRSDVPEGVVVWEINGPFFFGVADTLNEELRQLTENPKVIIVIMKRVPAVDATGIHALKQFHYKCRQRNIVFMISGVRGELLSLFMSTGVARIIGNNHIFSHLSDALAYSRLLLQ